METKFLQQVSLAMAQERSVDAALAKIVEGLAEEQVFALVRIWMIGPGDICSSCPMADECRDRAQCLHLVATQGRSVVDPSLQWNHLDGHFRRMPLGVRKVGRIGGSGQSELLGDKIKDQNWIARPDWAREEGIRSFAGHPLVFRGETLGVLAVFSRSQISEDEFSCLGTFANQAAVAIANVRAYEELDLLHRQRKHENEYLREEIETNQAYGEIIGNSSGIHKVLEQVELVAPTDASVLIRGETGTGKELIARAIHERSTRAKGAFIKVNCAAIPRDLFESEFFGHIKGAFTGAIKDRVGRFGLAHQGTLFLDEVGEIPMELQGKLLRVLQEGTFERIGESKTHQVDVRVIAATHRDLGEDAATFRQDLFFRLSVFPIEVLPLRKRSEDIPLLVERFVRHSARRLNLAAPIISDAQLDSLRAHDWPGNIRELQNVIERAVILARGGPIDFDLNSSLAAPGTGPLSKQAHGPTEGDSGQIFTEAEMRQKEAENLRAALTQSNWKVHGRGGAAELLGIKPTTLAARMKKLGIRKPTPISS